jgi:hypothetical protein
MAEIITCPACGRKLQVPESFYGQKVQCPDCAHQFVADPHAESVQSPPTAVPTMEESPRRRTREYDDDSDDDFDDMRPLRRSGVPHRGGMILAIGIIALVIPASAIICGPLAWILGNIDLAEIRAGNMDRSGEGMVQAGRILGIVSTIMVVGSVLFFCLLFGFIAIAGKH